VGDSSAADAELPPAEETVRPVQDALRLFGNSDIIVNSVVDRATEKAIRTFKDMFALPVIDRIERTLIDKMREIGILG